jgi:hypothetical protein
MKWKLRCLVCKVVLTFDKNRKISHQVFAFASLPKFKKHLARSQSSRFGFGNEISNFKKKKKEGEIQKDHKMKKLHWD